MRKDAEMTWFLIPKRDENYQWWWGFRKVRLVRLGKNEQQKYYNRMKEREEQCTQLK